MSTSHPPYHYDTQIIPTRRRSGDVYHPTQLMAATMGMHEKEETHGVSFPSSFFTSPYMDPMSAPHDAQQQQMDAQKCVKAGWKDRDCTTWCLLTLVWILNIILCIATYYLLINWAAFTWVVGSAGWTSIIMVITLVSLLYLLFCGVCVLGYERGMKDSYLHLHDSPCSLYTASCFLPLLILTLFITLALLTHTSTPITTRYMHQQANAIVTRADTNRDGQISYAEFTNYTITLTPLEPLPMTSIDAQLLAHKNRFLHQLGTSTDVVIPTSTPQQQQQIHALYDRLNSNHDDHLSESEVYTAIDETIQPQRERYATAAGIITIITFLFGIIYWIHYRILLSLSYHRIYRSLYQSSPWTSHLTTPFMKTESVTPIPHVATPDRHVVMSHDDTHDIHIHQHITPRLPSPTSTHVDVRHTHIMYDGVDDDDSSCDDSHVDEQQRRPILRL